MRSAALVESLRASRQYYVKQLCRHMQAPDGSYEEGFVIPGSMKKSSSVAQNLQTNNPLSLHKEVRGSFGTSFIIYIICFWILSEPMESMVLSYRTTENHSARRRKNVSNGRLSLILC